MCCGCNASAKKLHSSVLLSVSAKENVEEIDHVVKYSHFILCKSTKKLLSLSYMAAILKITATADEGTFAGAPISLNIRYTSKYMCTKFGVFKRFFVNAAPGRVLSVSKTLYLLLK